MTGLNHDSPIHTLCNDRNVDPYCKGIFQTVVENVCDMVIVLDEKLEIIYANPSVEKVLGRTQEEMLKVPYRDLFTEESWSRVEGLMKDREKKIRSGIKDGERTVHRLDLLHRNGDLIRSEFHSSPVYDADDYKGAILVIKDISEAVRVHEELMKRDEMLHLINKIMRHDIRNRLSIAFGFLGLLRESNKMDRLMLMKSYDAVGKAIGITRRMSELETLTMNGMETEPVDLKKILEELSSENDIRMDLDGDCIIKADKALVSVFENLINNSILHGNASNISITARNMNGYCQIIFADDGDGMPEKMMSQVFEEGISYGPRKGSGLGLFIVKRTIERYGGSITIGRNQPKGLFFRITLPLHDI